MLLRTEDTIVAVASAPGGGLRGIVRVSGPQAVTMAQAWFPACPSGLRHATAIAGEAILNQRGDRLPGELYVWPDQRSYTRQPTVEFHTLGSPPLLARLVQTVCSHGARTAEPGEFTLRAFLAGRLDLTQAEAVLGVIDAPSRTELDVALRQLGGGLAAPLNRLRNELLDALAHLEAGLDFVEEDIEFIGRDALRRQIAAACDEVAALSERVSARDSSSGKLRVVLYGRPNVGKSSLLNALARSQQAIVSDVAGTTRDYIAATIDGGGQRYQLIDTAGVWEVEAATWEGEAHPWEGEAPAEPYDVMARREPRPPDLSIDAAAQYTSQQQSQIAHLRLLCLDATRPLDAWERREVQRVDPQRLVVLTKCDAAQLVGSQYLPTSSISGLGLSDLQQAIARRLTQLAPVQGDVVAGTAARCRDSLNRAAASLQAALDAVDQDVGEEYVAGELRVALEELGRIAGAIYTDDILDRIFSRFCIGK